MFTNIAVMAKAPGVFPLFLVFLLWVWQSTLLLLITPTSSPAPHHVISYKIPHVVTFLIGISCYRSRTHLACLSLIPPSSPLPPPPHFLYNKSCSTSTFSLFSASGSQMVTGHNRTIWP